MSLEKIDIQKGKIKNIKVKSLFGLFNYDIPLEDSGVTILVGVNGSGKTTIFRILNSILEKNFHNILDVGFDSFEVYFENGDYINCKKIIKNEDVRNTSFHVNLSKKIES